MQLNVGLCRVASRIHGCAAAIGDRQTHMCAGMYRCLDFCLRIDSKVWLHSLHPERFRDGTGQVVEMQ